MAKRQTGLQAVEQAIGLFVMTPDLESMRLEPALDLRVPPKRAQRGDRAAPDDGDAEVIAEQRDCRQRLFALFAIALSIAFRYSSGLIFAST